MIVFLGYIVELVGLGLIIIGAAGAAYDVFPTRPKGLSALPPGFSDVLKELPKLLEAIFKGPKWAIAILFGIGLIWLGHQMTIGGFG